MFVKQVRFPVKLDGVVLNMALLFSVLVTLIFGILSFYFLADEFYWEYYLLLIGACFYCLNIHLLKSIAVLFRLLLGVVVIYVMFLVLFEFSMFFSPYFDYPVAPQHLDNWFTSIEFQVFAKDMFLFFPMLLTVYFVFGIESRFRIRKKTESKQSKGQPFIE